ncbi:MAG: transcription antitermination factor NusB [Deltaproteobacteria bacterium]|nr:transcription antitermination factor NusB [Deltaproteobacteria bacterium]
MTKRRKARELALQFLYEEDGNISNLDYKINCFYNDFASESLIRDGFIKTKEDLNRKKDISQIFNFFADIVRGTLINLEKIDGLIRMLAKNWTIERMSRVDRNLLRLSIYEILFIPETPKNVVINEAIEIAKKFGNDESPAFINGILDAAVKVK